MADKEKLESGKKKRRWKPAELQADFKKLSPLRKIIYVAGIVSALLAAFQGLVSLKGWLELGPDKESNVIIGSTEGDSSQPSVEMMLQRLSDFLGSNEEMNRAEFLRGRNLSQAQGEEARSQIDDLLEIAPRNPRALRLAGMIEGAIRLGESVDDVSPIESYFEDALGVDPDDPNTLSVMGSLQLYQGRIDEAIESWLSSLAQEETPLALANLSDAYLRQGDLEEARRRAERATEVGRRSAFAWAMRAQISFEDGKWEDARDQLVTSVNLDKEQVTAFVGRAYVESALGNFAAARRAAKQAMEQGPHSLGAVDAAAKVAAMEENWLEAQRLLQAAIRRDRYEAHRALLLALVLRAQGQEGTALDLIGTLDREKVEWERTRLLRQAKHALSRPGSCLEAAMSIVQAFQIRPDELAQRLLGKADSQCPEQVELLALARAEG